MIAASLPGGRDGTLRIVAEDMVVMGPNGPFDPAACGAVLPWARSFPDGPAPVDRADPVRRPRGAAMPGRDGDRRHATICAAPNGAPVGRRRAGVDVTSGSTGPVARAAGTRPLPAGTVNASGTVRDKRDGGPGRIVAQDGAGCSRIAEQCMVERIQTGAAVTPFLADGDRVGIWMEDAEGRDLFDDMEQIVRTT